MHRQPPYHGFRNQFLPVHPVIQMQGFRARNNFLTRLQGLLCLIVIHCRSLELKEQFGGKRGRLVDKPFRHLNSARFNPPEHPDQIGDVQNSFHTFPECFHHQRMIRVLLRQLQCLQPPEPLHPERISLSPAAGPHHQGPACIVAKGHGVHMGQGQSFHQHLLHTVGIQQRENVSGMSIQSHQMEQYRVVGTAALQFTMQRMVQGMLKQNGKPAVYPPTEMGMNHHPRIARFVSEALHQNPAL